MLGWTILFALLSLSGLGLLAAGHPALICIRTGICIFAALFIFSLLTRAVRSRSH
jgi:hypothetical protein